MKKILYGILIAIIFASCNNEQVQDIPPIGDPPGYSLFIWSNESDRIKNGIQKWRMLMGKALST